ncbi:hypothetical protein KFL_004570020 [Klebsormidium nitens]|uniref:Proteasome assembly chaperone 1 n=1 Tax=Klebsormidium nitens TaxID=105231 RepID=A0A1Y1ICW8_KLENI|nr:hypothetical protein KFL_004570020 [Klebsormidium nitens]|eukprot:GAQ88760.1 hypothetical protein KFL_004570020 [Klebsormidium nitens]
MALFYDPITDEAGPSRTWEEDEEEFEELYGSKGEAAYAFKLLPAAEQHHKGGKLQADLLMVGASSASRVLLSHLGEFGDKVGAIYQDINETDEGRRDRSQEDDASDGHLFQMSAAGGDRIILVSVPEGVRQEGAAAWARALFGGVSATRTVVLGSIPRSKFLGAADEGASPVIYTVETSAQRAATGQAGTNVTYLPTGNLVDGVAAAVVSHCQVRNLVATLLVNIDQTSGPDQKMVQALTNEIKECLQLQSQHFNVHWPDLVAKSQKDLASRSRGQSWSELYS